MKNFHMEPVPKARNLHAIGWTDGYMLVQFHGGRDRWIYGPAIPEAEKDKLLRVPYPDKLFQTNIRNKYRSHKIGSK